MIERLLDPSIGSATFWGDDPNAEIYPEEAAFVRGVLPARLGEFYTGRACARRALRAIGMLPCPIPRGLAREPVWPTGAVGSITHCLGFRAAAVARRDNFLTIGIDAEQHDALPAGVLAYVMSDEHSWLSGAPLGIHWDRLIFSAKESVFKAWYPITQRWLGFKDVAITFDVAMKTFRTRFLIETNDLFPPCSTGKYLVDNDLVITALALPN